MLPYRLRLLTVRRGGGTPRRGSSGWQGHSTRSMAADRELGRGAAGVPLGSTRTYCCHSRTQDLKERQAASEERWHEQRQHRNGSIAIGH